ncbi:MAG: protein-methionine-sulfoxide reductase catalytic subunit MsrP [Betaproteobacteria bacterium]|nr:protein-methionine-sulfoxide reductase catalytic subunit MsrP [Betaproteobacteria bacterium]
MLIRSDESGWNHKAGSEITPQRVYQDRRAWMRGVASGAAGAALALWAGRDARAQMQTPRPGKLAALAAVPSKVPGAMTMERLTTYQDASTYNNFYEFGTDKSDPLKYSTRFQTTPWSLSVEGLVKQTRTFAIEDLLKLGAQEERIYRLRCVEGWSMVIPWIGYSLSELLRRVEPLGSARFVEFVTAVDSKTMPNVDSTVLEWPYVEGLRLDEAMHPLTLLSFGMYGEILPKQNGAPVRLVVPWKYGFKSSKSLVKIRLTEEQPRTSWVKSAPREYGFFSNVNPNVDHPRWSQATERRIGEDGLFAKKRKTLMFNGYESQVASMYAGMDLRKFY